MAVHGHGDLQVSITSVIVAREDSYDVALSNDFMWNSKSFVAAS